MILDPIADFRKSQQDVAALAQALHQGWLRRACEAVLQNVALRMPPVSDPTAAAAIYQQMFGAKQAIEKLLDLDQPLKDTKPGHRTDNVIQWPAQT